MKTTCIDTIPTAVQFRKARKELLAIANCYETRKRKFLRGVYYDRQRGTFRWSGQAHDYTVCIR